MTSPNRTAYPTIEKHLSKDALQEKFKVNACEKHFIHELALEEMYKPTIAALLKIAQNFDYLTPLSKIPDKIIIHLAQQLNISEYCLHPDLHKTTLHRYRGKIRYYLGLQPFQTNRPDLENTIRKAAHSMSDPADLINVAVETLRRENIEIPAFSTLDRLTSHIRHTVHLELYEKIASQLSLDQKQTLDRLLQRAEGKKFTPFHDLKQNPGTASLQNMRAWSEHLHDIKSIIDPVPHIAGISHTKTRQFASEAKAMQVSELLDMKQQYEAASSYHQNNYRPLLWQFHKKHRTVLFRILDLFQLHSATQDKSLLTAFEYVCKNRHTRRDWLTYDIDLGFASQNWQQLIIKKQGQEKWLDRRMLEVCVFVHLADELGCANIYIDGSESYGDPNEQLLTLSECAARLPMYCQQAQIPANGSDFIQSLQKQLAQAAQKTDAQFPQNSELGIDENGTPHLKRQEKAAKPDGLNKFQVEIRARMPERHLLDILKHANHWTEYTRHFGPPSGSQPKISAPLSRYLFAVFGNGCLLGDSQVARHAPLSVDRRILQRMNAQHINTDKLEAALRDLVNEYSLFDLVATWGQGKAAIADGTHMALVENNLLGEHHIRYGGYGGIAYHHISDNYIALFCHFIACGVWEGIYILDGLWKNISDIQPDTLHADTHGQSEPIFGLAHLLGIKLFPRMRNWNDVVFYRPCKAVKYQHIDSLFTDTIDWKLIETHWPDMMQIVLSIQAGKVLPSMLLRKLGSKSRKNRLYRAFRELGRVERTIFLLRYISQSDLRFNIRAETTKIESFHSFLDWIAFGGNVIKSGDPIEQAKRMKYMDVIANSIMLQNVVDLTNVLNAMATEGFKITPELTKRLSPYMREHILRFGKWTLDMNEKPEPIQPKLNKTTP